MHKREDTYFEMVTLLDVVSHTRPTRSITNVLTHPIVRQTSLSFAPPPLWANQLPQRLNQIFPELHIKKPGVFLKAFVHPSFTTEYARGSTMAVIEPLGNGILQHALLSWLFGTVGSSGTNSDIRALHSCLLSDESLSFVLKDVWKIEDMILTDSVVQSVRKSAQNQGLIQWVATQQTRGTLPLHYHPSCLKALVGAVYLNDGIDVAHHFVFHHIFSHVLDFV